LFFFSIFIFLSLLTLEKGKKKKQKEREIIFYTLIICADFCSAFFGLVGYGLFGIKYSKIRTAQDGRLFGRSISRLLFCGRVPLSFQVVGGGVVIGLALRAFGLYVANAAHTAGFVAGSVMGIASRVSPVFSLVLGLATATTSAYATVFSSWNDSWKRWKAVQLFSEKQYSACAQLLEDSNCLNDEWGKILLALSLISINRG
jgi:hypothetical protein